MLQVIAGIAMVILLGAAAPAAAAEATLDKIKRTGTIVLGHREASPPFSFVDDNKKAAGYAVDLCERIAHATQRKLGLADLKITYVPLTAENRFSAVADGNVDIECGNTTNTLGRQEQVDFTNPVFVTGASLLVRTDSAIESFEDLRGKSISVVSGTTTEEALEALLEDAVVESKVIRVKDHGEAMALLENGTTHAHAGDQLVLIGLGRQAKDPSKLAFAADVFSYEPYALAVRRNDADFRLVANRVLAGLYRTGEIVPIYNRWFGGWGGEPSRLLLALFALNGLPE